MMLGTDTSYKTAMYEQTSPAFTTYSMGGIGVRVGAGDGVSVMVGVRVTVAVDVAVGIAVGSTTLPEDRRVKNTAVAPMATKSASNPSAAGRVNVNSGMRLP